MAPCPGDYFITVRGWRLEFPGCSQHFLGVMKVATNFRIKDTIYENTLPGRNLVKNPLAPLTLTLALLLILLVACQPSPTLAPVPSTSAPTNTLLPTVPPTPTRSQTPTLRPTSTRTPFPTQTLTPTPTPTLTPNPIHLAGLEVISVENVERVVPLRGFYAHSSYYIDGLDFSPDSTMLASAGFTESVKVWDTETGAEIFRFVDRYSGAEGVSFSPDGKLLATRTGAYLVNIWDTTTWQSLRTLDAETVYSGSIAFSPDGKYLATTGAGGSIDLWSTETWEIALNLPGNESDFGGTFVFSGDRKTLVSYDVD